MSWTGIQKECFKIVIFNRVSVSLKVEFKLKDFDVFMIGGKLREGLAVGLLGLIVALEYEYDNNYTLQMASKLYKKYLEDLHKKRLLTEIFNTDGKYDKKLKAFDSMELSINTLLKLYKNEEHEYKNKRTCD